MNHRTLQAVSAATFLSWASASGELVISEFMASNSSTLADEDGQFPDWVEIENTGSEAVDLTDWYLTDQSDFSPADADSFWRFPARTLAAGERLVVFASSKDRKPDVGGELHTNFQLSASGGYLALIAPDGSAIATEFSPAYPEQRSDISYGFGQAGLETLSLVSEGDEARVLIPGDGSEGLDWAGGVASYDDSAWLERVTGVGFEEGGTPGGFTLIDQFDSLNLGEVNGQGGWVSPVAGATIDVDPDDPENQVLVQSGANVRSWKSLPIANGATATMFFRMRRDGLVNVSVGGSDVTSPGTNFGDFEVQLNNQNDAVLNARDGGSFDPVEAFDEDVWYDVWLVMNLATDQFEVFMKGGSLATRTQLENAGQTSFSFRNGSSGDAMANFFARTGSPSTGSFFLDDLYLADGTNFGNPAGSPGLTDFIASGGDLEAQMSDQGSSAYLRIPFTVPTSEAFSSLLLKMRYDDGFVAYLNGTEIASRNAPLVLGWDAVATTDHLTQDAIVFEEIDVLAFQSLLNPAGEENILAIHGLNIAADDGDFLITPVLEGVVQDANQAGLYFTEATPNAANVSGVLGFVSDTEFSVNRGFYETPFELVVDSDTEGATIVYTLDGSTPSLSNGTQVTGPVTLTISETTPVRAAAFKSGYLATNVDTQTYFFLDDIISQEAFPAGYPTTWKGDGGSGSVTADYGMDPEITESASYRDVMDDALLGIPTISIVTDQAHLFDPGTGIYQNPQQSGSAWERPTSVEIIRPDGLVENIQVNAGIRIQGGHTRLPSKNPKHSFRLSFKDEFGPKSLNYDLFPGDDGATKKFDQLILRGSGNQSWLHHNNFKGDNRGRAQYIRDQWAKDTQLAMSGIGLRSMYAHLYINGIYWGMYNPSERASAGFGESYLGGEKEDYDALNSGDAIDGAEARANYVQMLGLSNSGLADQAKYVALGELLDIEALTDYMIINQYGANLDWDHHNWYAIRNRDGGKWRFLCWDSEFVFISPTDNVLGLDNNDDPSGIWKNLLENEEYRLLFADRVQKHLTNGGLLTPDSVMAVWDVRKNQMFEAIVAESARWGDYRRDVDPAGGPTPIPLYDRDGEWTTERNRLFTDYFPVRTSNLLQQYRAAGYLPTIDAPVFSLAAGQVSPASSLQMTSPDGGVIYYTLDGSDPRIPAQVGNIDLLVEGDAMKVSVPLDDSLGSVWRGGAEPFDDSGWLAGTAAGFERSGNDYAGLFDIDLQSAMYDRSSSCYVRMTFEIPDQAILESVAILNLGVRYDDGFAAFINGVQVASDNAPDPLTWETGNGSHSDSLAAVYQPFTLPASAVQALRVGTNVLSFQAFNATSRSSDFLFDAILSAETGTNGALSPNAIQYSGAIPINSSTMVNARVRNGADWSPLNSANYATADPAAAGNLVISEVMYHPAGLAEAEFLEFENISAEEIDLAGVFMSEGIDFTFPFGTTLAAGERILVVRDLVAFETIYGAGHAIAGIFENETALNNSGERLTLKAKDGSLIQSFSYSDQFPWPMLADGGGASLILRKAGSHPNASIPENWRSSVSEDGNPGSSDAVVFAGVASADADGDGLTALMEYALGTSDENASDGMQALQLENSSEGLMLRLREAAGADDAVLEVEVSNGLASWNSLSDELVAEGQNNLNGGIRESLFSINGTGEQLFFRLKVRAR
ncbi:lamin tail domain-containing protein [Verrucomicrobiaceae bacterium 227]